MGQVPASAQEGSADGEPDSGAVVRPPDAYLDTPNGCLPLGPSAYIAEMAKLGPTFPPRPIPAHKPDPSLAALPYRYFHLDEESVPVLDGPSGSEISQPFQPGFVYIFATSIG